MRTHLVASLALLGCVALSSCGDPSGLEGDCNLRFRFQGDIYRPASGIQTPHRGDRVGTAPAVDCEGDTRPGLGEVELFSVVGEKAAVLLIVAEENGDAVYLNDTIPWSARPQLVKDSEHYPSCSGPTRFTGILDYVDPEDMPQMEEYDTARVPYTAIFTTREGTGVGLDRWGQVTLQAEITADTRPVPGPRFLERAISENEPVRVTAECHADTFEVSTIRFSR